MEKNLVINYLNNKAQLRGGRGREKKHEKEVKDIFIKYWRCVVTNLVHNKGRVGIE